MALRILNETIETGDSSALLSHYKLGPQYSRMSTSVIKPFVRTCLTVSLNEPVTFMTALQTKADNIQQSCVNYTADIHTACYYWFV
jgi:hypothetical protein